MGRRYYAGLLLFRQAEGQTVERVVQPDDEGICRSGQFTESKISGFEWNRVGFQVTKGSSSIKVVRVQGVPDFCNCCGLIMSVFR